MSAATEPPKPPPPLTPEQKHRVLSSPIHKRIKREVYATLALGMLGATGNIACVSASGGIIATEKWWVLFSCLPCGSRVRVFSLMWSVYTGVFMYHVKYLGWPDQLLIDIGWMMFAAVFSAAFLCYLFRKMIYYGTLEAMQMSCQVDCEGKLSFVRISPLVFGLLTLVLAAIQLFLCCRLYWNPIINPPLDAHGMPIVQDPETGKPLPLDAKGQPIIPDWLKPPRDPSAPTGRNTQSMGQCGDGDMRAAANEQSEPESSAPEHSDEDDEKALLQAHEMGQSRRSSRGARRDKRVGSKRTDEVEHGKGSAGAAPTQAAKAARGVFERAKGTQ
ncbi:hypothetical protein Rhopal_000508-T1 [Rhodotorula paludigena]|uniref:Uncharacterized protein n=1 Tax=Rhodotorula paludigena TaxID=86838 RepID=A0AAV5GCI7_9BASI|nr:hypothetical protein Rhopal_000508-T1 [Rhodotorula paludigena]